MRKTREQSKTVQKKENNIIGLETTFKVILLKEI